MDDQNPKPPKENDFANLFEDVVELLQFAVDSDGKSDPAAILPKNLEDKLAQLERDVDAFCEVNAAIVEAAKGNGKIVPIDPMEMLTPQERALLERSKELVAEAEEKRRLFNLELDAAKASGKLQLDNLDSAATRKKKFKRFGIRSKWEKL